MENVSWKKMQGQDLKNCLAALEHSEVAGIETEGDKLMVMKVALRLRGKTILMKLWPETYNQGISIARMEELRTVVMEVEIVSTTEPKKILRGFRCKIDQGMLAVEEHDRTGHALDSELLKSARDMVKIHCAHEIAQMIAELPEMVDKEYFLSSLMNGAQANVKMRLQNGTTMPYDKGELTEATYNMWEIEDRAKKAEIDLLGGGKSAAKPKFNLNDVPFDVSKGEGSSAPKSDEVSF